MHVESTRGYSWGLCSCTQRLRWVAVQRGRWSAALDAAVVQVRDHLQLKEKGESSLETCLSAKQVIMKEFIAL